MVSTYYLCDKYYKPLTAQYYIAKCVSWLPRLTLLGYLQIGLINVLSEQNLFMCRGLIDIDHPNSHQTLALANDTSLSSGKSSEDSLQKIIETDFD